MKTCPQCATALPPSARFCLQCGAAQPVSAVPHIAAEGFDWQGDRIAQAIDVFNARLAERVAQEQHPDRLAQYQERLYGSGFREVIQRRFAQWSEGFVPPDTAADASAALRELAHWVDDLLDYFFILHCQDINTVLLPEAILRYQTAAPEGKALRQMALDYLDFSHESERVYTDLLTLPAKKIRNVGQSFLFPERDEVIWFICDQTLLGTAKEGFAMTEKALYWKSGLQPAQRVYYHKLFDIRREKEWLLINDLYFNASPTLNTKITWLLRRLGRSDL